MLLRILRRISSTPPHLLFTPRQCSYPEELCGEYVLCFCWDSCECLVYQKVCLASNIQARTTVISAVKLYEIKALNASKDVPYESITLSVLSVAEVLVGALTSSLPPLRHLFETTLNKVLPESVLGARGRTNGNSYALPSYSSNLNTRRSRRGDHESDNGSEKTILQEAAGSNTQVIQGKTGEIMRTTHVSLTVDNTEPRSRNEDWA